MLFNSFEFIFFLPIVLILYWYVFKRSLKYQNFLILISSYIFYGWWDYRFLSLIFLSTLVDYVIGLKVYQSQGIQHRKMLLWVSILFNIGVLGIFKYYNFFIASWIDLFASIGYKIESKWTLNIILPVGISFYTFQTMSYTIDVYRKSLEPTKDFISFASFVAFFPQLVAGPIERASNLLPQILKTRKFNYQQGVQGLRLILWGMFKKVVIADSLAPMANDIFDTYNYLGGGTLWLGVFYFAFQIYCDFSGYSDIAIGTSKLFGFELMSNFKFPYFSRNIGEFWRRWHISLSSWFRDYLYIPLGGSKGSKWVSLRNIFIIFIVSGFWHGANWTFIVWGLFHGMMYVPSFMFGSNRKYTTSVVAQNSWFPSFTEVSQMGVTFFFVLIGWVFFRNENLKNSFDYLSGMFFNFDIPKSKLQGVGFIIIFLLFDWGFRKDERLTKISNNIILRWLIYLFLAFQTIKYFGLNQNDFIYFKF
jgi:D-alanyl-lipoteichoic acid acyltransferase DltB (MBOAT superfamily)